MMNSIVRSSYDSERKRKHDQKEQFPSKKRQIVKPSPAFEDNLSSLHLTSQALAELNRRNSAATQTRSLKKKIHVQKHIPVDHLGLSRFARHGGPDLTNLRGVSTYHAFKISLEHVQPPKEMPRSERQSTKGKETTERTKSTSLYDRKFGQYPIDHGVFPGEYNEIEQPLPANWDGIVKNARRSRESLTKFTNQRFKEVEKRKHAVRSERQASDPLLWVEGKIDRPQDRCTEKSWGNLNPLTDGTITTASPDVFYGSPPTLPAKPVKSNLHKLVILQADLSALPNFTVAIKRPHGSLEVAERQARCYRTLCVRTVSVGQIPDGNAYTITSMFNPESLKIYTSHSVVKEGRTEYLMTKVGGFAIDDRQSFISGATVYRNLRHQAREQRLALIKRIDETFPANSIGVAAQDSKRIPTQTTLLETVSV